MKRDVLQLAFTAIIFFQTTCVLAQDFVVTLQGDTLKGEVRALSYNTDKRVQLTEPGKKKTIYPFFKVKSFSVDGEVFHPVKGPNGYAFMKILKSGYLTLYAFQPENQTAYSGLYLLKKDGNGTEVPNITFKKSMRNFLNDCPSVSTKIEDDVLNKKDLDQIIDEYNLCIENRTSAPQQVVAEKAPEPVKVSDAWGDLENKVKSQPDFAEKANALEMINEIKSKISSSQKIPNFLIEGLKSALPQEEFKAVLENALKEIN